MKVYKIEVMIIDHDGIGEAAIKETLENANYPNDCISPHVIESRNEDIGEWSDDHPLNSRTKWREYYNDLFREYPDPDWND